MFVGFLLNIDVIQSWKGNSENFSLAVFNTKNALYLSSTYLILISENENYSPNFEQKNRFNASKPLFYYDE